MPKKEFDPTDPATIEEAKELFGLSSWDVTVEVELSGGDACGCCHARPEYQQARIVLYTNEIDSARARFGDSAESLQRALYHELCEAVMAECTMHSERNDDSDWIHARDLAAERMCRAVIRATGL